MKYGKMAQLNDSWAVCEISKRFNIICTMQHAKGAYN